MTRFGKLCLGGWGTGFGRAIGWDGLPKPVAGDAPHGEAGVFVSTPPGRGEPIAAGACRDVGRDMWTRLTQTRDAPVVYVYANQYGGAKFQAVTMTNAVAVTGPGFLQPYVSADSDAQASGGTLASYISSDELNSYLATLSAMKAATPAPSTGQGFPACPAVLSTAGAGSCPQNIMDLARNNPSRDGNADIVWGARAFPFYPTSACQAGSPGCIAGAALHCDSADNCGTPLPATSSPSGAAGIMCSTATPSPTPTLAPAMACAAVNFNNRMYLNQQGSTCNLAGCSDGSWFPVFTTGTQIKLALDIPSTVHMWFSGGAVATPSGCFAQTVPAGATYLITYQCNAGLVQITLPAGALYEVQAFAQNDHRRTRFYPYR